MHALEIIAFSTLAVAFVIDRLVAPYNMRIERSIRGVRNLINVVAKVAHEKTEAVHAVNVALYAETQIDTQAILTRLDALEKKGEVNDD